MDDHSFRLGDHRRYLATCIIRGDANETYSNILNVCHRRGDDPHGRHCLSRGCVGFSDHLRVEFTADADDSQGDYPGQRCPVNWYPAHACFIECPGCSATSPAGAVDVATVKIFNVNHEEKHAAITFTLQPIAHAQPVKRCSIFTTYLNFVRSLSTRLCPLFQEPNSSKFFGLRTHAPLRSNCSTN